MNKNTTLGMLFYLRKDKLTKDGKAPIYLRITIDGKRANLTTNRDIEPEKWDDHSDKMKGSGKDVSKFNMYLDAFKGKVLEHHSILFQAGKEISAESVRNAFLGKDEKKYTLMEVIEYHNQMMKEKVGIDIAPATLVRYNTVAQHVKNFMEHRYSISDITLKNLSYQFITDFEHYLKTVHRCNQNSTTKTVRHCNHNSTLKYVRNVRKIVNMAVANDWLVKDPFMRYKSRLEDTEFVFLTEEELERIKSKEIRMPRLDLVRDLFVFSCYSGLAYVDLMKLNRSDISLGIDGQKWIYTYRTKTEVRASIPLFPEALALLDKYANHPQVYDDGKLMPSLSNQKLNAYLKELAEICSIEKNLTFHVARKTFGTTILINNDVPIETTSKILGHANTRITEKSYAKVLNKKIVADMGNLKEKLYGSKGDIRLLKTV
ncbi:MAG TPA: site-specific integrase [Chitinophagales bacterium]|nr:site-specific integrase [Chitinophagales bacterium]